MKGDEYKDDPWNDLEVYARKRFPQAGPVAFTWSGQVGGFPPPLSVGFLGAIIPFCSSRGLTYKTAMYTPDVTVRRAHTADDDVKVGRKLVGGVES
jgi:hypothetical protein